MSYDKRPFIEKLIAQWPGALGFLLIGLGLAIVRQMHQGGQHSGSRAGLSLIVIGIAALGYWALANRNNKYNF